MTLLEEQGDMTMENMYDNPEKAIKKFMQTYPAYVYETDDQYQTSAHSYSYDGRRYY